SNADRRANDLGIRCVHRVPSLPLGTSCSAGKPVADRSDRGECTMKAATIWLQLIAAVWMTGCGSVSMGADWIGSSSCGSSTCHGNTVGRGPAWSSSYTLSRSRDPHATAGSLLYDWDSRAIVAALSPDLASLPDDQRSTAYDVVL